MKHLLTAALEAVAIAGFLAMVLLWWVVLEPRQPGEAEAIAATLEVQP